MYVYTMPRESWDELNPDKQAIRTLITKHRKEASRLRKLMEYYEGQHKILTESRKTKLVCNHAKDIADTASSYFIGNTVSYKSKADITAITEAFEQAGADEADGDNGLDLSVYGRTYEYIYPEEWETDLTIKSLSPENTFMVYDDTIEQKELFAVYYYARKDDSDKKRTVYIATILTEHYKYVRNIEDIIGHQGLIEEPDPYFFEEIPVVEYLNNKLAIGDYELQIPLIDAYNALMSDRITDTDTDVTNGTTYYYIVSAVNAGTEIIDSNEASAEPIADQTPPATEAKLKVVLEVSEALRLSVDDDLNVNTQMAWTSSDQTVATVNEKGIVTALAPGNTIITVKSVDGSYTDYINVLVVENADDYRLAIDLNVGGTARLTADDFTNTTNVTWAPMDSSIANVTSKGKVTALSKGLVLITAKDNEGNIIGRVYVRVREQFVLDTENAFYKGGISGIPGPPFLKVNYIISVRVIKFYFWSENLS